MKMPHIPVQYSYQQTKSKANENEPKYCQNSALKRFRMNAQRLMYCKGSFRTYEKCTEKIYGPWVNVSVPVVRERRSSCSLTTKRQSNPVKLAMIKDYTGNVEISDSWNEGNWEAW